MFLLWPGRDKFNTLLLANWNLGEIRWNRNEFTAKLDQHPVRHAQYPLFRHLPREMVTYRSKLAVWEFCVTGCKYFITVRNRSWMNNCYIIHWCGTCVLRTKCDRRHLSTGLDSAPQNHPKSVLNVHSRNFLAIIDYINRCMMRSKPVGNSCLSAV